MWKSIIYHIRWIKRGNTSEWLFVHCPLSCAIFDILDMRKIFLNFHSIFSFFSKAQIYTDHIVPLLVLWVCKPDFGRINLTNMRPFFLRCGLADVLNALQRINGVRTAQDTRSKHYGQGVSWHAVCLLLQGDPRNIGSKLVVHHKKRKRPMFNPAVTL